MLPVCLSASYIGYNLVLAVLTVIISVVVYSCHHRDIKTAAVPRFVRLVSTWRNIALSLSPLFLDRT